MSAILIVLACVGAALGVLVGFFKKFTKTSFWGITVLLTLLIQSWFKKSDGFGTLIIIVTVAVLIVLTLLVGLFKKCLKKKVNARLAYSHYKNMDDLEENEARILNAVDNGDRREYKKLLKKGKKIKDTAGGWGVVDGVLGAVSGCVNVLMGIAAIILPVLLFADLSQISFLNSMFSGVLASGGWTGLGAKWALDLPLITALALSLRIGYKGGISSVLGFVIILGMIVGFAAASFSIASSEACAGAVESLKNGLLSGFSSLLGNAANTVAKVVLAAIIFLLSLIIIIMVGIFLPKLLDKLRENKVFGGIDGVLGAIVLCAVMLALLLVAGGIASSMSAQSFMEKFNSYEALAHFADGLYTYNLIGSSFSSLVGGWFGSAPAPVD